MAKLLRLDVAQLTDVGRKREHNEDNMAYVIPKDTVVMAKKGALFIVADGMGGHAAGEVASEIAVDTVSNSYYQDDNDDVPSSLLYAIRRANTAIHQRAAENMLRSGMGTTCVAAVLRGNVAYIANVGDSRAYLVRGSQIRQVSQDHSWVAEQVRAGLLTEEQARTHAQRNVITRSLGTQSEVEIDIFREVLEEGDALLLCSDGLSGMVSDEEIQRSVEQFVPQESVYHLIERANENGGGDNITAIVARVQETGVEPPGVRQPVTVGGSGVSEEDTARLYASASPGVSSAPAGRNGERTITGTSFPYSSGPLVEEQVSTLPQPALPAKKRRSRLFYPTLALVLLLILAAAGTGFYYFQHTNQTKTINQGLSDATRLINQGQHEATTNSSQSLQDLAQAQQDLQNLQKNYNLDANTQHTITNLQTQLVTATKTAITTYNQHASIALLPCTNSAPISLNGNVQGRLVAVITNQALSYTLAKDGKIYKLTDGANHSQAAVPAFADDEQKTTQFISMVGGGDKIFAISSKLSNNTPGNYQVNVLTPDPKGVLTVSARQDITTTVGLLPTLITSTDNRIFVAELSSSSNMLTILSYRYGPDENQNNVLSPAQSAQIQVTANVLALTAFPDQLFMVLADGEVVSTQIKDLDVSHTPTPVLTSAQIMPPLTNETANFTSTNPVPTAPQTQTPTSGNTPLSILISSTSAKSGGDLPTMSAGMVASDKTNHLYIGEPAYHRVLDLEILPSGIGGGQDATPTATPTTNNTILKLDQQYVSATYFSTIKSVTLDPSGIVNILGQNTANAQSLVIVNAGKGQACGATSTT